MRKYVFSGSEKNETAPHIFLVLIFLCIVTSFYYALLFSIDYLMVRLVINSLMLITYIALERSQIKNEILSYLTPLSLIAWFHVAAVYFYGDFLIYNYTIAGAMISLTYMKPKGLLVYIVVISIAQAILIFFAGFPMMGSRFTYGQNIGGYFAMVGLNLLIYIFCKSYTKTSKAKGIFLSNMSHEIRTPMNAIIGMTTIGEASTDLKEAHYALAKIKDASTHLLGVINDILDMSKIESGKFELSVKEFSFRKTLEQVINVISFTIEENEQIFNVNIDKKIPDTLIGDNLRLAQAITNLMGNAVKFTPPKGSISLNAEMIDEINGIYTIKIEISDTGIGISKTHQKKLFNVFHQADANITRTYGGSGLGLSITKNIVEMMDGEIWLESEEGKGSVFCFTVKMKRGDAGNLTDTLDESQQGYNFDLSIFSDKHILLAEDVDINQEIVMALLEPTGIIIECAHNGEEAVKMFSENPSKYDVIFMDLQMPLLDGYKATKQIRSLDDETAKTIPIIAMTANVFREDVEKCIEA